MGRKIGNHYENLALHYLNRKGLKLVSRNFSSRFGEIDLIMQDKDTLVFIEVRYRASTRFGSSEESITYHKQQKIIKTAKYYALKFQPDSHYRFDIVAINLFNRINWIKAAFEPYLMDS